MNQAPEVRRPSWLLALLPALLVALFYLPVLGNGFVNWDDQEYITDNPHIRHLDFASLKWMLTTFYSANWIPLTWFSLSLDFQMGGLDPKVYHLTNLVLHALNTLLVFLVCFRILSLAKKTQNFSPPLRQAQGPEALERASLQDSKNNSNNGTAIPETVNNTAQNSFLIPAALIAAVLFGLHPIHVESVAWATERKDVLCTFFYLAALLLYLGYASSQTRKSLKWFACLGLFLLALMSKPMAVTLPLVLLILDFWPLGRFTAGLSKILIEKIPFFVLALAGAILSVLSHAKALSSTDAASQAFWILNAFRSVGFYLWKTAVPLGLSPFYPFPRDLDFVYSLQTALAVFAVLLVSLACYSYLKKAPYLAAAWLFYLITLAPVIGLLQAGSQAAADRYTYLPGLAVFFLFSAGASSLLSKRPRLLWLFIAALTVSLGTATVKQIGVWKDTKSLWERVVLIYPDKCPEAHTYLGCAYTNLNRPEDAFREFKRALAIPPPLPITYNGIGLALDNQGKLEEAVQAYQTAISLKSLTATPHRNLWLTLKRLGRFEEGVTIMQEALKIEPDVADNYGKLGASYGYLKKLDEARAAYEKAHGLDPTNAKYLVNLAVIAQMQGRLDDGIALCREGISRNPREPVYYLRLAEIYKIAGKEDLVRQMKEKARSLAPTPDAPSD